MTHYRNNTIIPHKGGMTLEDAAATKGIIIRNMVLNIADELDTYYDSRTRELLEVREDKSKGRYLIYLGEHDILTLETPATILTLETPATITASATNSVSPDTYDGTDIKTGEKVALSKSEKVVDDIMVVAKETAQITADEILRLVKGAMTPMMTIKPITGEEVERIWTETPGMAVPQYEHKQVSSTLMLNDDELIRQAGEAVEAGEFSEVRLDGRGKPMPGTWTRIDTPAYKAIMEEMRNKAWTEGVQRAILILKDRGYETAAYQLASATINDLRWKP